MIREPRVVPLGIVHDALVSGLSGEVRAQPSPNAVLFRFTHANIN